MPTTRDPAETESTAEPEIPGAGVGATSFAAESVVGAPAVADGSTSANLPRNYKGSYTTFINLRVIY